MLGTWQRSAFPDQDIFIYCHSPLIEFKKSLFHFILNTCNIWGCLCRGKKKSLNAAHKFVWICISEHVSQAKTIHPGDRCGILWCWWNHVNTAQVYLRLYACPHPIHSIDAKCPLLLIFKAYRLCICINKPWGILFIRPHAFDGWLFANWAEVQLVHMNTKLNLQSLNSAVSSDVC